MGDQNQRLTEDLPKVADAVNKLGDGLRDFSAKVDKATTGEVVKRKDAGCVIEGWITHVKHL